MRNELLELISFKMIGARFVGTGDFLIRCSNGRINKESIVTA